MSHHHTEKGYAQQPQATPGMMIAPGGNRNAKNVPVSSDGTRGWSNGLCSCCNAPGTCFVAFCCPCITYSKNKHRYEHLNSKGTPDPEHGGDCCTTDCMIHGILSFCGVGFFLQCSQRGSVRGRYNIKGGGCGDCCSAFCCTPCQLTQEHQELELEEKSFGNFKA